MGPFAMKAKESEHHTETMFPSEQKELVSGNTLINPEMV
jgi:hypothetical protein